MKQKLPNMIRALRKMLIHDFGYADGRSMYRFLAAQQACALLEDLKFCSPEAIKQVMDYRLQRIADAIRNVQSNP